eukprot:m.67925 g.67925  ORF g.67925 m.67925 type:complete len:588 (+) comp8477_c0_seq1:343-2106(+)
MAASDALPDADMLKALSQELREEIDDDDAPSSATGLSASGHIVALDDEDAELHSKREAARVNKTYSFADNTISLNQLKEQLADVHKQNDEYRKKLAEYRTDIQRERDRSAEAMARVDNLEADLKSKAAEVTRLDRLNQHLIDQVKSQPRDDRLAHQELKELQTKVESTMKERDAARAQVRKLEQMAAIKTSNLDSREADLRSKITQAREEKVKVLQEAVNHLEVEREHYEHNIEDLQSQVAIQSGKIVEYTQQIGEWEARHDQAEAERDRALSEVAAIKSTVQGLRRQNTETSRYSIHSDTMSRSSSVSNMGPLASEQVIAQRDDALDKCRRLQQQLFEERAAGGMSGASNQSTAALRSELAKLRMQHKHMTRELQATTARTADTESRAQQTITALQRELEQARMGPQLQSGDNTAQAIHALGSRQAEVRAYKGATAELRNYLQALTDAGKPLSPHELQHVLSVADTTDYDHLPDGWEMMISPEGLEYYVDHEHKLTTWAHPCTYVDPESGGRRAQSQSSSRAGHAIPASPLMHVSDMHETPPHSRAVSSTEIHPDHMAFQDKVSRLQNKHKGSRKSLGRRGRSAAR